MNPETMKLVVELLDGAKADAVKVILLLLAKDALLSLIGYGIGGFAIYRVSALIRAAISAASGEGVITAALGCGYMSNQDWSNAAAMIHEAREARDAAEKAESDAILKLRAAVKP